MLARASQPTVKDRLPHWACPCLPGVAPAAAAVDPENEQAFRSAVQMALRDRRFTRSEERDLFRLARMLGIGAERAHEILAETEAQRETARSSSAGQPI